MIPKHHHKNLKLLIDGQKSFKRIIERIRQTKKSIYINIFIWRDDKIGNIIGKELLKAANRGVKITISKDKLGSVFEKAEENKQSFFHKTFDLGLWFKQKLVDSFYYTQGEVKNCKQISNKLVNSLLNHKNIKINKDIVKADHSKYYIFDDKYLITGGMNIEDRTVYHDVSGIKWNDYMIEIKGEIFVKRLIERLNGRKRKSDSWFEFVLNSKLNTRNFEIKSSIVDLLSSANRKVHIQMAYFGEKEITNKIIEVSNKGIELTIILPKKANLQTDYNHKVMKQIIKKTNGKVKVYLCKNMLHAKMMDIDEEMILIGSANLNRQTMDQLSELDVLVAGDIPFTKEVRKSIVVHFKNSERVYNVDELKYNKLKASVESIFC